MALFKCVECCKAISTETEACPHCGHPNPERPKTDLQASVKEYSQSKGMKTSVKVGLGCIAVLVVLGGLMVLGANFGNTQKTSRRAPATKNRLSSIGVKEIAKDSYVGSTSRAEFDKLSSYVVQEDRAAFNKALSQGISRGTCVLFSKGEKVHVVDSSFSSGVIKVRRYGEVTEYWTNREAVR